LKGITDLIAAFVTALFAGVWLLSGWVQRSIRDANSENWNLTRLT
jgi:hypothetical protein